MEYTGPAPAPAAGGGADKYHGAIATGYDAKREQSPKWLIEQEIITRWFREMPKEWEIFDCPVGTGRFFDCYQTHGFKTVYAMDKSADMLDQAVKKMRNKEMFRFAQGNILQVPLNKQSVDASIMCRLTRWLSLGECQDAMKELQRITRHKIIFTARTDNHPHARPLGLFEAALKDGWRVSRNEPGSDIDYRIIMLERA